ncbi:G-protein coupled receptor GRL101-like [Mercenaria mercenaria]|uniref:G-protein coupled receptor GRL101-like n=1 Tax=Mercenaria mercenaria TaxID=6596 RepID=UPI00234F9D60|nr:G-protein coupled receptor GRL101-like [Mercenaria mercenaria]
MTQMGPATCSERINVGKASDELSCAENGQIIPAKQTCVFDIDNAGFPLGCRDGSHLTNCENFTCPNETVKCPGSYCLPVRFVCDGNMHCERGHDEENCGCDASQSETLIMYEKGTAEESFISQFSRQFYTPTSIVRILQFESSKPLKSFGIDSTRIHVTDRQIDQRGDVTRFPKCNFKVMSRDFLKSVKFTMNGTKGLIYIQNSPASKEVADEMFANLDDLVGDVFLYSVTQDLNTTFDNQIAVPKITPVRVRRWKTLTAVGAEYFSALCKVNAKANCHGMYKCASSKICIPHGQVCDGYRHCIHGDDESLCDFRCPYLCSCLGYYANCSATDFRLSGIKNIPNTARNLDLSLNNRLNSVLQHPVLDFIFLSILNLSKCDIKDLSRNAFNRLRNLQLLDVSYNIITTLPDRVFSSLTKLRVLHIHGNHFLSTVHPYAFRNLFLIRDLNLANLLLTKLSAYTFAGLKLKSIDLSHNKLEDIEAFSFSNLSVNFINFEGNTITNLNKKTFTGVADLKVLKTPSFKFCCIRPNYLDENNCFPTQDEFSSCEDLMRHSALQFLLWLIGVLSLIGNCLSLIYRLKVDRKRLTLGYGIFVTNLAAADFLMGVYLLMIAIADAAFRKRYIYVDDYWRGSFLCNLAGVLSTISSESSVFFLCLITLDRLLVIKYPFGTKFFTTKNSVICVIIAWVFSSFIAILPVVYEGYFQNKFYSRSGVCIALPLTRERPPGWVYSILIFVVLNFITFLLVAVGQWSIFYEIQKSSGMAKTAQTSRKRDLKVARNLLLVVATDFMCWFPIGVMGALALSGYAISGDVYAWAAVFILPVNSALNPILYTLTAIIGGQV